MPCVRHCGHQREYPTPNFIISRGGATLELPNPIHLHQLLTSASSTAATVIPATTTTIAGTIQSTHRNPPPSAPISCFHPPSTVIFDVLWWCSTHAQRLQFGQSTHSIYAHGYLNPYPAQVEAAHVKSIASRALASMEYFPSTETRSGHTASRRWTRRGFTQLYRA